MEERDEDTAPVEKTGAEENESIQAEDWRKSSRQRAAPRRLTYPSLGNPLVLVMQSLLSGLDKAFSQALDFDTAPYISQLTPLTSEIV